MAISSTSDSSAPPTIPSTPAENNPASALTNRLDELLPTGNPEEWIYPDYDTSTKDDVIGGSGTRSQAYLETDLDSIANQRIVELDLAIQRGERGVSPWSDPGGISNILLESEPEEVASVRPFSGGLELHSPDLNQNRKSRSNNSSLEALLSNTAAPGVINSTTDWFLLDSEQQDRPLPVTIVEMHEERPTSLLVNDTQGSAEDLAENGARVTVVSPGLSPSVLAVNSNSDTEGSVFSLSIFEVEEQKLLDELRRHSEYAEDSEDTSPEQEKEIKEMFPELNAVLTDSEYLRDEKDAYSGDNEEGSLRPEELKVSEKAKLGEVFIQEDLNCEYTVKLPQIEEINVDSSSDSRESSLDSEAKTVFRTVTEAESSDERRACRNKPVLPPRQRISFEDVNNLLESMENLHEPVAATRLGWPRDRRPILKRESTEESRYIYIRSTIRDHS